jgi:hypothetical protein
MEQIDVELGVLPLRSRSLPVRHSATTLAQGLEHGEQVVLRDRRTGHYFRAAVVDVDFELEDTCYRLELGARITSGEAAEAVAPAAAGGSRGDRVTARDLLEMLAELRRGRQQVRALVDGVR